MLNSLLADALIGIAELKPLGFLHVAGERFSRYESAVRVAEKLLPRENVVEASVKDFAWRARRPRDSSLNAARASRLLRSGLGIRVMCRIFCRGV